MAKRITTKEDLNLALERFFKGMTQIGASSKGDVFDETVRKNLLNELNGAVFIDHKRWGSDSSTSIFKEYREQSLTKNFDFTSLKPIIDNGVHLNLMVIDKPNGSQNWPDLLIVYNQIGVPLEVKSTEKDSIVWNSGFPRFDSLYIFNCYGKSKTTCFLGQHAINQQELSELMNASRDASFHNKKCSGERWSYYVRNMFNSTQSYIENKKLLEEIQKINDQINEQELILKNSNSTQKKKNSALKAIDEKTERFMNLDNIYKQQVQERESRENDVFNFIRKLPWDSSQHSDFS